MKAKTITKEIQMKMSRRVSREEEIAQHGKQIAHRSAVHKSKKTYSRKSQKAALRKGLPFDLYMGLV